MERLQKINKLRLSLDELRDLGDSLKENFSEFEESINKEEFPQDELLDDLDEDLFNWRAATGNCNKVYKELFKA